MAEVLIGEEKQGAKRCMFGQDLVRATLIAPKPSELDSNSILRGKCHPLNYQPEMGEELAICSQAQSVKDLNFSSNGQF